MQFIELQLARKRKFQRADSVTYETTNCYTYKRYKNLFASIGKLFSIPLITKVTYTYRIFTIYITSKIK